MEGRCRQRGFLILLGDLPERLDAVLAVAQRLVRAVEGGRAGVAQVEEADRSAPFGLPAGDTLDGFRAPVSANVGEDLRSVSQQRLLPPSCGDNSQ